VLDGALALALPTKAGQTFHFEHGEERAGQILWQSYDERQQCWFEGLFAAPGGACLHSTDDAAAQRLTQIFQAIAQLAGDWPKALTSVKIKAQLDFPRHWGLGSSSTLIAALAQYTGVDAFQLLAATFGGSGYDLACAFADGPIFYQLQEGKATWEAAPFAPPFKEHLYFVGLGAKQNSREGIAYYRARKFLTDKGLVQTLSELTKACANATTLVDFEDCLREHEQLIAKALDLPRVADLHFSDYNMGTIKSLGAWGGDFVLATSMATPEETRRYFLKKGFTDIFAYADMVL